MLRHDEKTEEPGISASDVRVTPSEFTDALAAIEARREAEAYHDVNTLPIGQAVKELSLDVSPEEVLAEVLKLRAVTVQSERDVQIPTAEPTPAVPPSPPMVRPVQQVKPVIPKVSNQTKTTENDQEWYSYWKLALGSITAFIAFCILFNMTNNQWISDSASRSPTPSIPSPAFTPSSYTSLPTPPTIPALGPRQTYFGSLKEGQIIQCTYPTVLDLMGLNPDTGQLGRLKVQIQPAPRSVWTVIKHDGHAYVHGFVTSHVTQTQLTGRSIVLYSRADVPELDATPVSITLRLDTVHRDNSPATSGSDFNMRQMMSPFRPGGIPPAGRLQLYDVKLDHYAWEPIVPHRKL